MAKKSGGKGEDYGLFGRGIGRMFDFNRDGKLDFGEKWVAFKVMEDCMRDSQPTYSPGCVPSSLSRTSAAWRDDCEDGSEFGIDPEDYDTEDEYNDALEEAKAAWRDDCVDGSEYGIDPEDYDTEDEYNDALEEAKAAWRGDCEDGYEFGIDPEDYDTEDEYNDALEEAKTAWRDDCEDGSEYGIDPEDYDTEDEYNDALEDAKEAVRDEESSSADAVGIQLEFSVDIPELSAAERLRPEDFPNRRQYDAAYTLQAFIIYTSEETEKREKAACRFILDNADTIPAANYLSIKGGFLYSQAIQDNFDLPCSLPEEDVYREMDFSDALRKIAKRDIPLVLEVWQWCLAVFLPYAHYAPGSLNELTSNVIGELSGFPEDFRTTLARYMHAHPDFLDKVVSEDAEMSDELDALVAAALQDGLGDTALTLFRKGLRQAGGDWKQINRLTEGTISWSRSYTELEAAEYIKANMLPLVKAIDIGMVRDEIEEWEAELDRYIAEVESECEKYAYSRKNAWRNSVPDGTEYGLDPRDYDSEAEYRLALREAKYGWREYYAGADTLGLDVNDFETEEDYEAAFDARRSEQRKKRERQAREQAAKRKPPREAKDDKTIYTLCGVLFPGAPRPYQYRTDDTTLQIGDRVVVPVGDKEATGEIVSVGRYTRVAAPFPVEQTKFILRRVEGDANAPK